MSPAHIENIYKQIPYIKHAFVYGFPEKTYLIGIFAMHQQAFKKLAKKLRIKNPNNYEELCEDKDIH